MTQENEKNNMKNLTITEMKKQVKKLTEQTEHSVPVGEDFYKVKIDNVFRKTKLNKLLDDLVVFFDESNNNVEMFDLATPYTSLLFMKHFTSVEISDDIDEALEILNVLIDLDLIANILNVMPESEILKAYELINSTVSRMKDNIIDSTEEAERLANFVENDELKEMLQNGKSEQSE